ncbi:MAG TPA: DUF3300 domain-containing protein [Stellaceae bacterium]|nr:DUF3300 domain-containing protein [Stellaceae bacterium]
MKRGRFVFPLLLLGGVVAALGLSHVTSPALRAASADQPMTLAQATPPATSAPANQPSQESANPPAAEPANPSAQAPASPPAAAAPPTQAAEPAPAPAQSRRLTRAELSQLLAPIALYPDQLLSQILMASTYPLQVVEAARWVKNYSNRRLRGQALTNALRDKQWDPSVMALVPFPHVLEMMSAQLDWTQRLGTAFVAQQADCMNEVQRLRQEAIAAGNFKSGPQCRCVVENQGGYVRVSPANPEIVYAPVYDAAAIYGPWPYPDYPPIVFPYPVGFAFAPGFFIGFGVGVDVAFYGPLWGWSNFDWGGRNIIINSVTFNTLSGGGHTALAGNVWTHDATRSGSIVAASALHGAAAKSAPGAAVGSAGGAGSTAGRGMGHQAAGGAVTAGRGGSHASASGRGGTRAAVSGRGGAHASASGRGGPRAAVSGRGGSRSGVHSAYSGRGGAGKHGSVVGHGGGRAGFSSVHGGRGVGSSGPGRAMMGGGGGGPGGGGHGGGGGGHGGGGGGKNR